MKANKEYPVLLQFDNLTRFSQLTHFTTTVQGGVSEGNYSSFNLGEYSGDKIESVIENRKRLCKYLDINLDKFFLPYQIHSDEILIIDNDFLQLDKSIQSEKVKGIDAIITDCKNVCIGITTADCVPILLFDPVLNVLAAVHAGWRSTVLNVAEKTIQKMSEIYGCLPKNIIVGIGASISQVCFEVGEEVTIEFEKAGFPMNEIAYRNPQTQKMHINLKKANKYLLEQTGIPSGNIEVAQECTYSQPELFFSARRQTIHSGRMVTGGILS